MTDAKPLRADARRNRDALIAKARELFAGGCFNLRFDDFAKLAGVGTGTLYRHFPTREALAEAVYREELAALCDRARHLQATLPAAEALAAFLHGFVDHLHTHEGLARTLATLMATRPDTQAEGAQALGQAIADLLTAGVRAGTIRDDVGAGTVTMALHGICAAYDQPAHRTDARGVVTLLLAGLRLPPGGEDRPADPAGRTNRSDAADQAPAASAGRDCVAWCG
ncbi:TetR/AcrR family transcriptional regulator [Micromonospora yangpuensis]|uniref:Transcriptional regulator, TetR family n=1 Tax=Micromonospora yangpuensis TaxID=683228 RepID=A0A1C6UVJ3_9ACTN|nr:TetR/AcrR family transcriptional regulator [Micromonospora yangpuensis]GGM25983.1 TetR family transcriptional regulator [Micromonospora yangpuensis]SCL58072.1 transcriptional regulator, TetR family [Micromonospora yangpuensis]